MTRLPKTKTREAEERVTGPIMRSAPTAARAATLFVLPYLLLALVWLGSNPGGAAPDEDAHLVKALGMARLDIGTPLTGPALDSANLIQVRNASISRVVEIPARLSPTGYACFQFRPDKTADCQPRPDPGHPATGDVAETTTIGAYPPFAYVPLGLAARAATTTTQAFVQGRLVVLAEAVVLLWMACWHLVRWLGRRALLGVALSLTPLAVFCMGILSTSGLEIFGALGVGAAVVVAVERPESLADRRTWCVVLVCGLALVLSRQLGVVTMAALVLLLLACGGWRPVWKQLRAGSTPALGAVVALGLATAAVAVWELAYDHPALLGPWVSGESVRAFVGHVPILIHESVGWFGWLDTRMPAWSTWLWALVVGLAVAAALLLGRRRERLVIVVMIAVTLLVADVTYARVFYPINAGLQGRHMLPLFSVVPLLSGVVLARRLSAPALRWALVGATAVFVPTQVASLYLNGKRYAVGLHSGPLWFLPDARWEPALGWTPWLVLAIVAGVALAASLLRLADGGALPEPDPPSSAPAGPGSPR